MRVRVLVAEEDLNLHMLIHDILEIIYKDVAIDRALNGESLLEKIAKAGEPHDLFLYDIDFDDEDGKDVLSILRRDWPHLDDRIVVITGSKEEIAGRESARGLRSILKPFSLDDFSEAVRQVCVS